MAFMLYKMDVGITPPIDYMPATEGEEYTIGEALVMKSGAVSKAAATNKPTAICVGPEKDGNVPVMKVQNYMVFGTTLSVAPGDGVTIKPGDKLTLSADAKQVTATTTSGVATVEAIEGQEVDSVVHVRFKD